jgi:hypothetical protein
MLIGAALAWLAVPPALAQDAWEFMGWSERGVRMRAPDATGWPPRRPANGLPERVVVLQVQDGEWVLFDLPGEGRRQAHINDVRIRRAGAGNCTIIPGPQQRSAGSQGLGPGASVRPCP